MTAVNGCDRLIPLTEWCRITGEGRSTTYEAVKRGEVLAVKLGRMTRFSEAAAYRRVQEKIAFALEASKRHTA